MGFHILVVDDSATTRAMIRRVLDMTDLPVAEVYEASDGLQGLETLRSRWVDLVLADVNMPVMDGLAMTEAMAADPKLCGLPVVVVSSEGSRPVLEALRRNGVRQIVRKPFEPMELRQTLEKVLGLCA